MVKALGPRVICGLCLWLILSFLLEVFLRVLRIKCRTLSIILLRGSTRPFTCKRIYIHYVAPVVCQQ